MISAMGLDGFGPTVRPAGMKSRRVPEYKSALNWKGATTKKRESASSTKCALFEGNRAKCAPCSKDECALFEGPSAPCPKAFLA
jgi:hypothetical protein